MIKSITYTMRLLRHTFRRPAVFSVNLQIARASSKQQDPADVEEIVRRHGTNKPSSAFASREEHNAEQSRFFDGQVDFFLKAAPSEVEQNLAAIVRAVPGLGPESRVCDVGAGTGALIPHLQKAGVKDILAVDLSEQMLAALKGRYGSGGTLGNEASVRGWRGDVNDLPYFYGPFDAIFYNAVFGNMFDQKGTLIKSVTLMKPGSYLIISHPVGQDCVARLSSQDPVRVPHGLLPKADLEALISDMPFSLVHFEDKEGGPYVAVLRVPDLFAIPSGRTVAMGAEIVRGFGRGSRDLGFPTANLNTAEVAEAIKGLPTGVYFGWAKLEPKDRSAWRPSDLAVHPMVLNIGRRPTMEDQGGVTIEAHVVHKFSTAEFYGECLKVLALGFLRPEIKFRSLDELTTRILIDIGLAKTQLAAPSLQQRAADLK